MRTRKKTSREELAAAAHLQMLAGLLDWVRLTRSSNYVSTPEGKRELEAFANEMIKNWRTLAALPSDKPGMVQYVDAERAAELACGWAFDAGMREAERDRSYGMTRAAFATAEGEFADSDARVSAAVASERERCAAWFAWSNRSGRGKYDAQRAAAEIASGAPAPREESTRTDLPVCTCGCSVARHYMTDGMDGCRDCATCDWFTKAEGAPAPREG